jgi:site-specific DNA recombinase
MLIDFPPWKSAYNRRLHLPAVRKNMPKDQPRKHQNSSTSWRLEEEWIAVSVPAIIDQETWELARKQLKLNKERAPRNNKKHDYLLKGLLVCGYCQLRMLGHAGNAKSRRRRYLCSRKETLRTNRGSFSKRTEINALRTW